MIKLLYIAMKACRAICSPRRKEKEKAVPVVDKVWRKFETTFKLGK